MILDQWQQEVLAEEGNCAIRAGRQVGKSTVISIKAAEYALKNPNKLVMIIASVERQSYLLFEKTYSYLADNHKGCMKTGKDRPTKHIINLKNGSRIMSLPCGLDGHGVRGFNVSMLIVDEAAFVPQGVFDSLIPSLTTKNDDGVKKSIIVLSTPFGKQGYFYECFKDPSFKTWHIRSSDCPRADQEFLARQKANMTKAAWSQEFLGEFVDELRQFFKDDLIRSCMTLQRGSPPSSSLEAYDRFMGCDIARLGGDETALISVYRKNNERVKMFDMDVYENALLTETVFKIKEMDKKYDYKKIYIDSGGLGVGVVDALRDIDATKRKIVEINNSQRSIDKDKKRKRTLIKEDLYNNLLWLMESHLIEFFDSPEILLSLKSVQYEYTDQGDLKIFGNYTHIAEALVRAAWCMKDKTLNIWCY